MLLRCCRALGKKMERQGENGNICVACAWQAVAPEAQGVGLREQPGLIWVPAPLSLGGALRGRAQATLQPAKTPCVAMHTVLYPVLGISCVF